MIVDDFIGVLQQIAPLNYAASWDNVGLLAGSPRWPVKRALLTIDLTAAVLEEAIALDASLIVAYHPPIFEPIKRITDHEPKQRLVLEAMTSRIALYSPHTALDAAPDGVNDWLAGALGAGDVRALEPFEHLPETEQCKLITFCPAEAVDRIRNGLASVGAGRIGDYQLCSFEIDGRGTFVGGEGTNPTIGRPGTLERVNEIRLEMVCPKAALALAAIALREFHPYEEPPIEIISLHPRPQRGVGQGRRVTLDQPATVKALAAKIKERLGVPQLQVAIGDGAPSRHERIGLCAGAGGSLLTSATAQGCQLFITGEMRHHDVLAAQAMGVTVMLAGHTNTERGYLKILKRRLQDALPEAKVAVSRRDRDPLEAM